MTINVKLRSGKAYFLINTFVLQFYKQVHLHTRGPNLACCEINRGASHLFEPRFVFVILLRSVFAECLRDELKFFSIVNCRHRLKGPPNNLGNFLFFESTQESLYDGIREFGFINSVIMNQMNDEMFDGSCYFSVSKQDILCEVSLWNDITKKALKYIWVSRVACDDLLRNGTRGDIATWFIWEYQSINQSINQSRSQDLQITARPRKWIKHYYISLGLLIPNATFNPTHREVMRFLQVKLI